MSNNQDHMKAAMEESGAGRGKATMGIKYEVERWVQDRENSLNKMEDLIDEFESGNFQPEDHVKRAREIAEHGRVFRECGRNLVARLEKLAKHIEHQNVRFEKVGGRAARAAKAAKDDE